MGAPPCGRAISARCRWLAVAVITALSLVPLRAQETGTLRGTVRLVENGGLVDGAVIVVVGTGVFALTDEGRFEITNVPIGEYEVVAERERLTAARQRVTIGAGETATVEFELRLSPVREEVVVTAEPTVGAEATLRAFNAVTTLDSFELARDAAGSIGEALEDEPGIANRSFGPGSSRPIVRGFGGDRVLIIEDGIRTGDLSSTSDHHGVTIDPASAERIEITRGPATLLYGSNVIGLINVITPHAAYRNVITPPESYGETLRDGTRGQFGTAGGSANRQAGMHANALHSRGRLLYWGSGAYRKAGDYDTPEGRVFNSATELTNARAGLGYFGAKLFSSGALTFEDSRFGLPFEDRFHAHAGADERDHDAHGDVDTRFNNANFTHSHRVPALQELYNFGPHLGNYEIGNPDLEPETMRGLDLSFRRRVGGVQGELNFYVYDIDNFIFGDLTDEVADNLRILDIVQGDSRFVGFDARTSLSLGAQVWATLGVSYVNATLTSTDEALPRIPPLRGTLSLDIPYGGLMVSPEVIVAGRQDRIFRDETATTGYAVVNVDARRTFGRGSTWRTSWPSRGTTSRTPCIGTTPRSSRIWRPRWAAG